MVFKNVQQCLQWFFEARELVIDAPLASRECESLFITGKTDPNTSYIYIKKNNVVEPNYAIEDTLIALHDIGKQFYTLNDFEKQLLREFATIGYTATIDLIINKLARRYPKNKNMEIQARNVFDKVENKFAHLLFIGGYLVDIQK